MPSALSIKTFPESLLYNSVLLFFKSLLYAHQDEILPVLAERLGCSDTCYSENAETINEIVTTFTVEG